MSRALLIASSCLLLGVVGTLLPVQLSQAQQLPDPAPSESPVVVTAKKEKKICTSVVATGSILPKRICKTESQVAAEAENTQRLLEDGRRLQDTAERTRMHREAK